MTPASERGIGGYARAIEQAITLARDRPTVISDRDWSLISDWHSRGIPLGLILEVLDDAVERAKRRHRSVPRSISYIATAVEETWQLVIEGRRTRDVETPSPLPSTALFREHWARSAQRTGGDLGRSIEDLLRRLDDGLDPSDADAELDAFVVEGAPVDLVARVDQEVDDALRPFRERMAPDVFDTTRRRARVDRLRRELDLPRLALGEPRPDVE